MEGGREEESKEGGGARLGCGREGERNGRPLERRYFSAHRKAHIERGLSTKSYLGDFDYGFGWSVRWVETSEVGVPIVSRVEGKRREGNRVAVF